MSPSLSVCRGLLGRLGVEADQVAGEDHDGLHTTRKPIGFH
jgi:hypothetical protein